MAQTFFCLLEKFGFAEKRSVSRTLEAAVEDLFKN
jgi:hypothetical protein